MFCTWKLKNKQTQKYQNWRDFYLLPLLPKQPKIANPCLNLGEDPSVLFSVVYTNLHIHNFHALGFIRKKDKI